MDPISALSVATATIQFVDFLSKLFSETCEVYASKTGELCEASETRSVAEKLSELNKQIEQSWGSTSSSQTTPITQTERDLKRLCHECNSVADELISVLNKLKQPDGSNANWAVSFRCALKSRGKQKEVERLERRLERFRNQLAMHILVGVREQQTRLAEDVQGLSVENRKICDTIINHVQDNQEWKHQVVEAIRKDPTPHNVPSELQRGEFTHPEFTCLVRNSLYFEEMSKRKQKIPEAHVKTFRWIFEPPNDKQRPWADFTEWLGSDSSIYWITGKAGAGKSTLMKYISTAEDTQQILEESCPPDKRLCRAHFYFWNSGSAMQISREGLIRTLLYELVSQNESLAIKLFPDKWELYRLFRIFEMATMDHIDLQNCLIHLVRSSPFLRFVLFIDGLNEFKGNSTDLLDLITFIKQLADEPNVKTCVASRPWPVFEEAFNHQPNLKLENLTYPDFVSYVESNFNSSPGYADLKAQDPQHARILMKGIATKASGVFLWVTLVVKSLLMGLADGEPLEELRRRLEALPPDLENLFEGMLKSIDPEHKQNAFRMLQCVRAAKKPLTVLGLAFAEEYEPNRVIKLPSVKYGKIVLEGKSGLMRRRLNNHCKGLLEASSEDPLWATVEYLHRTVRDFLHQPGTWNDIIVGSPHSFNVNVSLCWSFVPQILCIDHAERCGNIAHWEFGRRRSSAAQGILVWFLRYASDAYNEMAEPTLQFMARFADLMWPYRGNPSPYDPNLMPCLRSEPDPFVKLSALEGMSDYAPEVLELLNRLQGQHGPYLLKEVQKMWSNLRQSVFL